MKKLLFVLNNLEYGGITKAFINLLDEIKDEFDIDLLLFSNRGTFIHDIPDNVNILPSNKYMALLGETQKDTIKSSIWLAFLRAFFVVYSRVFDNRLPRRILFSTISIAGRYDAAISYMQDHSSKSLVIGCNDFIINKVNAGRKISFVHCDFEHYGGNTKLNRNKYLRFDRIACVSEGCADAFLRVIPDLKNRVTIVRNCTNYTDIQNKAVEKTIEFDNNYFNMISVSRISEEKGYIRAVVALKDIFLKYQDLRWYIVGDGAGRQQLEKVIETYGLVDRILLLGSTSNPYKFVRQANLFFMPSLHEAAPMVFDEAKALNIPILSTETTSAVEMVEKSGIGFVCMNNETGMRDKLDYILSSRSILADVSLNEEKSLKNNSIAVEQFTRLVKE